MMSFVPHAPEELAPSCIRSIALLPLSPHPPHPSAPLLRSTPPLHPIRTILPLHPIRSTPSLGYALFSLAPLAGMA